MVIHLEQHANNLNIIQLMCRLQPVISCFIKIHSGLFFWCWLTQVVLEEEAVKLDSTGLSVLSVLILTASLQALVLSPHIDLSSQNGLADVQKIDCFCPVVSKAEYLHK